MEMTEATRKRLRNDDNDDNFTESMPEIDSAAVKRLREDLLDSAGEDYDEVGTSSEDLYSYMKKFEEEITASPDLCDSSTNLAYLSNASDDDLGIPAPPPEKGVLEAEPLVSEPDLLQIRSSEVEETSGFGFGDFDNGDGEFATLDLDGLFEYSDLGFGSDDFPFRPESLSAQ